MIPLYLAFPHVRIVVYPAWQPTLLNKEVYRAFMIRIHILSVPDESAYMIDWYLLLFHRTCTNYLKIQLLKSTQFGIALFNDSLIHVIISMITFECYILVIKSPCWFLFFISSIMWVRDMWSRFVTRKHPYESLQQNIKWYHKYS